MAETDPVQIVVEIVDSFSDELTELREELERIDKKEIDVGFKLDEGGEVESVKAQLQAIEEMISTDLVINVRGAAKAAAIKEALDKDMRSTLHVDTDGGGDVALRRAVNEITNDTINDLVPGHDLRWSSPATAFADFDDFDAPRGFGARMPDVEIGDADLFEGRRFRHFFGMPLDDAVSGAADSFDEFGKNLLKYKPSIMDWWNVIALLIPVMIALAGAAIGVAAALGAVATAGIAILGLGLLGWGETMGETFQNLKTDAMELARELFGVFRPVGAEFEPILRDWLGGAPHQLSRLTEPLQRMTVFADGLASMGVGVVDWLVEVINVMSDMSEMAVQVSMRFGGALGDLLIDALSAMLIEVYKNQDAYMSMAAMLLDIIVIIFNVSKAVMAVLAQFRFLTRIITIITGVLSNKWTVALLTSIVTMFAMYRVILLAAQAWLWFGKVGIASAVSSLATRLIPTLYASMQALAGFIGLTNAATFSWMRLAAVTGVGLLIAGAGWLAADAALNSMSGPSGGMGGTTAAGGNTYINIQGDVRKREMDRLLDEVGGKTRNEMSIQNSMAGGQ